MVPPFLPLALFGYAPIALLVFAPGCAILARRRNRDAETWLLLGVVGGPIALAWILALGARPRRDTVDSLLARRRRTPMERIPVGSGAISSHCLLCGQAMRPDHRCRPEAVEDRIQRRWTVRVGGQRILGPPF